MATDHITKRSVDALRAEAQRAGKLQFLWDDELKGFGCRAAPKGPASWVVQKWRGGRDGKASRIVIGRYPPMTVDQARNRASGEIGDFEDPSKAIDIFDRKKQAKKKQKEIIQAGTLTRLSQRI